MLAPGEGEPERSEGGGEVNPAPTPAPIATYRAPRLASDRTPQLLSARGSDVVPLARASCAAPPSGRIPRRARHAVGRARRRLWGRSRAAWPGRRLAR